jgi:hypothetical protein
MMPLLWPIWGAWVADIGQTTPPGGLDRVRAGPRVFWFWYAERSGALKRKFGRLGQQVAPASPTD